MMDKPPNSAVEFDKYGQPAEAANDGLWDADRCASWFGCARWTFVNRISKLPSFPRPHIETSRHFRRWLPQDVKDFKYRRGRG
jgi:hypothetical protein